MGRMNPIPVSRQRRKSQKGSAMVELALCFLSFMLLTVGAVDFSMAMYASNFCAYAAREATRWTSVHGANSATASNCTGNPGIAGGCAANSTDVANFVANFAVALNPSNLTVTTTWTPDTNPGAEVNIRVAYLIAPLSGLALPQGMTVSSSSQMEMVH
jgi:Flp pilus assembly protein TadG